MTNADGEYQSSASTANILSDPSTPPVGIEANQVDELRTGFDHRESTVSFAQGVTSSLLLAVFAAVSGTAFHFGYGSGVM